MDWSQAFAPTTVTKLYLDDDQKVWIDVRDELGIAEERALAEGSLRGISRASLLDGGSQKDQLVEIDLWAGAVRKILVYLVDWNVPDANGKTIEIKTEAQKLDAIKALRPEFYRAIEARIDAHVAEQRQKKVPTPGAATSAPIS